VNLLHCHFLHFLCFPPSLVAIAIAAAVAARCSAVSCGSVILRRTRELPFVWQRDARLISCWDPSLAFIFHHSLSCSTNRNCCPKCARGCFASVLRSGASAAAHCTGRGITSAEGG
jgi:hypothetical protein